MLFTRNNINYYYLLIAFAIWLIRKIHSTEQYDACPKRSEVFEQCDVYRYNEGNIHYFCLQASFTNEYLCSKTPASNYPPIPNPNGHLFFIHPTWKTNEVPAGCDAQCRLFNPLAPFKSDDPKLVEYNSVNDALVLFGGDVDATWSVPNITHCNCTESNCRNGYIGFKIDTSSVANKVVRYSFSMSKILCWKSTGNFATLEEQIGMNASANQPSVTDCPFHCDCTVCPINCTCPNTEIYLKRNDQKVTNIPITIENTCRGKELHCSSGITANITWEGPGISSTVTNEVEHTLNLADDCKGHYKCIVRNNDENCPHSSKFVTITCKCSSGCRLSCLFDICCKWTCILRCWPIVLLVLLILIVGIGCYLYYFLNSNKMKNGKYIQKLKQLVNKYHSNEPWKSQLDESVIIGFKLFGAELDDTKSREELTHEFEDVLKDSSFESKDKPDELYKRAQKKLQNKKTFR